jgi:WD40 repeat protein
MAATPLAAGVRITGGDLWVQGTPDGRISVGTLADGKTLVVWQAHEAAVTGLALAPDASFLISAAYDGTLCRWDPRTGRLTGRL